jgi:hypothetical protein
MKHPSLPTPDYSPNNPKLSSSLTNLSCRDDELLAPISTITLPSTLPKTKNNYFKDANLADEQKLSKQTNMLSPLSGSELLRKLQMLDGDGGVGGGGGGGGGDALVEMANAALEPVAEQQRAESALSIASQVCLPFLIAGMGMVGAGLYLDIVQVCSLISNFKL